MVREGGAHGSRGELLTAQDELIAPDWLIVEAASTFWKKIKQSEMLELHAERHIDDLPLFFARLHSTRDLLPEAFRLAVRLKHPVYDCIYVALAQRADATLVTADVELARAVQRSGIAVRIELLA